MNAGIWPPYEAFYIEAMLSNTRSAAASIEWVGTTLEAIACDESGESFQELDTRKLLDELQNVVVKAAALSRYFWPAAKGTVHQGRAKHLREALDITEDNALRNRALRNAIEHFDERLDAYIADGIVGTILPEYVGILEPNDGVPIHIFRAYYLDAGLFEMLGKRYEIPPLADEVMRLRNRLVACSHDGRLDKGST